MVPARLATHLSRAAIAQAALAVGDTAREIARMSRSGFLFPWALRVRLAELLLRGVFDTIGTVLALKVCQCSCLSLAACHVEALLLRSVFDTIGTVLALRL
jgi:hypothetical protein